MEVKESGTTCLPMQKLVKILEYKRKRLYIKTILIHRTLTQPCQQLFINETDCNANMQGNTFAFSTKVNGKQKDAALDIWPRKE